MDTHPLGQIPAAGQAVLTHQEGAHRPVLSALFWSVPENGRGALGGPRAREGAGYRFYPVSPPPYCRNPLLRAQAGSVSPWPTISAAVLLSCFGLLCSSWCKAQASVLGAALWSLDQHHGSPTQSQHSLLVFFSVEGSWQLYPAVEVAPDLQPKV